MVRAYPAFPECSIRTSILHTLLIFLPGIPFLCLTTDWLILSFCTLVFLPSYMSVWRCWILWNWSHRQCELPCGCWEWNPGPLKEQSVFLTSGPSLQPPNSDFSKSESGVIFFQGGVWIPRWRQILHLPYIFTTNVFACNSPVLIVVPQSGGCLVSKSFPNKWSSQKAQNTPLNSPSPQFSLFNVLAY